MGSGRKRLFARAVVVWRESNRFQSERGKISSRTPSSDFRILPLARVWGNASLVGAAELLRARGLWHFWTSATEAASLASAIGKATRWDYERWEGIGGDKPSSRSRSCSCTVPPIRYIYRPVRVLKDGPAVGGRWEKSSDKWRFSFPGQQNPVLRTVRPEARNSEAEQGPGQGPSYCLQLRYRLEEVDNAYHKASGQQKILFIRISMIFRTTSSAVTPRISCSSKTPCSHANRFRTQCTCFSRALCSLPLANRWTSASEPRACLFRQIEILNFAEMNGHDVSRIAK